MSENPQPKYGNQTMITLMCRRVELPMAIGRRIFALALEHSFHINRPVDMVLVAQAISYTAKNRHLLKRNYQ